jgi:hypothetical protein
MIFYFYGASVSSNRHARPLPRPFLPAATSTSCGYAVDSGVFASAALMTLLATGSGITYYLAASRVYVIHTWLGQPKFRIMVGQPAEGPLPTPPTIITTAWALCVGCPKYGTSVLIQCVHWSWTFSNSSNHLEGEVWMIIPLFLHCSSQVPYILTNL